MKPLSLLFYAGTKLFSDTNKKFQVPIVPSSETLRIVSPSWMPNIFQTEIRYRGNDVFDFECKCIGAKPCKHVSQLIATFASDGGIKRLIQVQDFSVERNKRLSATGLPIELGDKMLFEADFKGNLSIVEHSGVITTKDVTMLTHSLNYFVSIPTETAEMLSPYKVVIQEVIGEKSMLLPFTWRLSLANRGKTKMKYQIYEPSSMGPEFWNQLPVKIRNHFVSLVLLEETILRMRLPISSDASMNRFVSECRKFYSISQDWWEHACESDEIILVTQPQNSNKKNIESLKPYPGLAQLEIVYFRHTSYGMVEINLVYPDKKISGNQVKEVMRGIYRDNQYLYFIRLEDQITLSSYRPKQAQIILKDALANFETKVLPKVEKVYRVLEGNTELLEDVEPVPIVLLSELDQKFILLNLSFRYYTVEVALNEETSRLNVETIDGKVGRVNRNKVLEKERFDQLLNLHPEFSKQLNRDHFYLSYQDARKNFWLLHFVKTLIEAGFEVHGQDNLKGFRINKNEFKFSIKSGRDNGWFEMQTAASFGNMTVDVQKIAQALSSQENYVMLDDGSLGILPQEWIEKFGLLFRMSEKNKNGSLNIHPVHIALLPSDENDISDQKFRELILERQKQLIDNDHITFKDPSKKIKATLRNYQLQGFQWLQQMYHSGYGACLADDMGLGKTLQTICFIDFILSKEKTGRILVVCPTSLLFNWENELQKFAPHIKFLIYHGIKRDHAFPAKTRLILTSYGTLRNDAVHLNKEDWLNVILDESQAIKNPNAQMTLAVHGIKAKGRLILSGTPVQNNTFDLWSQFAFINPGLLGNKTFFLESFSNPIDKQRHQPSAEQLRKLVNPFILRRTKEQVAKDLPAKTESILWCEMDQDQRKVYEETREFYKQAIESSIEIEGISKSSFLVLEGMLRLRQICDAPSLLKKSQYNTISSTKLDELLRELEENTGNHKVLVFSQFTEMLALAKTRLQKAGILFSYLDGSTSLSSRKAEVERFQQDTEIRVFLISLKAGGVGLNLTEADYVYIVDPWWNPAAEQQAIDRSHRIGQNKPVFAYKMICKNSIEEKILKLQEHKKGVANDLIKEDEAIFKKLTKNDIVALFSS